jgi:hypothetical protein
MGYPLLYKRYIAYINDLGGTQEKKSPAIDDSQVVEHAVPTEPSRLKSITSVTSLADSMAGMDRTVTAPNPAGMTSMKRNVSVHKIEVREISALWGIIRLSVPGHR